MRYIIRVTTPLFLALLLALLPQSADAAVSHRERKIFNAVHIAKNQIGEPYVYGADGPSSFDCSGLVDFAYERAGISMPRTSRDQYRRTRHIKKSHMKRGDLMFYHSGGSVYHVAIFLKWKNGNRIILHSPRPGRTVQRDPNWTGSWWGGTLRRR